MKNNSSWWVAADGEACGGEMPRQGHPVTCRAQLDAPTQAVPLIRGQIIRMPMPEGLRNLEKGLGVTGFEMHAGLNDESHGYLLGNPDCRVTARYPLSTARGTPGGQVNTRYPSGQQSTAFCPHSY